MTSFYEIKSKLRQLESVLQHGEWMTYGDAAKAIGLPTYAKAVGNANNSFIWDDREFPLPLRTKSGKVHFHSTTSPLSDETVAMVRTWILQYDRLRGFPTDEWSKNQRISAAEASRRMALALEAV